MTAADRPKVHSGRSARPAAPKFTTSSESFLARVGTLHHMLRDVRSGVNESRHTLRYAPLLLRAELRPAARDRARLEAPLIRVQQH